MSDDTNNEHPSEDEISGHQAAIHNHPQFHAIGEAIQALSDAVEGHADTIEENDAALAKFIDAQVLRHAAIHRLQSAYDLAPPPLVQMFATAFASMWAEGFLVGQRYQSRQDAELIGSMSSIPDSLEGLT